MSTVASRGGVAWFSLAVDRELRIYRSQRAGWVLDGTVKLPEGMPTPRLAGNLSSTGITGGTAPDFTSHVVGADTWWFALAARLEGRWRMVPFDDQFGRRDPYTFAYGAERHLIHGVFDSCGCASGPTTEQWYRFADGIFAPSGPPGEPAVCSAKALSSAGSWPPLPDDPLVRGVARPFRVVSFACADGWALATDGHNVSVYEQHGRGLDKPVGRRWLRVGVGSPSLIAASIDFALPRSLLQRLGRLVGVSIPPAPRTSKGPPPPTTQWQKAPITVRLRPGDTYVATDLSLGQPKVLTVTIKSATATTVLRFRWHDNGWVELPLRR
jgi:hypothetical protein